MAPLPLALQVYTPHNPLGDWQIVILVDKKRNILAVERWHSSEQAIEAGGTSTPVMWVKTGIRAFRRQMPELADALKPLSLTGLTDEAIVEAVFQVLASVYAAILDPLDGEAGSSAAADFTCCFMEERKRQALANLSVAKHL